MKKDKLFLNSDDVNRLTQICEHNGDIISRYKTETIKGEGDNTENIFHVTVCHQYVGAYEKHLERYQFDISNKTQLLLFCQFITYERAARDSLKSAFDEQEIAEGWLGVYNEFYCLTSKGCQQVAIKD